MEPLGQVKARQFQSPSRLDKQRQAAGRAEGGMFVKRTSD